MPNDPTETDRAVRRDTARVRMHVPADLETMAITLNAVAARQRRQDNRFTEIFRDFDALHPAVAEQAGRLACVEAKIDLLLAAMSRSNHEGVGSAGG